MTQVFCDKCPVTGGCFMRCGRGAGGVAPAVPYYWPVGAGDGTTVIPRQLTEDDVRRIVREELARALPKSGGNP